MKTIENNQKRKIKIIEIKLSNMVFEVQAYSHYITELLNSGWSRTRFTAKIKNTGEGIGIIGGKRFIRQQMEIINSRPDLFLK
jgi:hypothetical protein